MILAYQNYLLFVTFKYNLPSTNRPTLAISLLFKDQHIPIVCLFIKSQFLFLCFPGYSSLLDKVAYLGTYAYSLKFLNVLN